MRGALVSVFGVNSIGADFCPNVDWVRIANRFLDIWLWKSLLAFVIVKDGSAGEMAQGWDAGIFHGQLRFWESVRVRDSARSDVFITRLTLPSQAANAFVRVGVFSVTKQRTGLSKRGM